MNNIYQKAFGKLVYAKKHVNKNNLNYKILIINKIINN